MSGTTMVFLIVLVSVGFGVISDLYGKYLQAKKQSGINKQESDQLKTELAHLKDRVAVLERIVTDEGYQVDKKIKSL
ncbi:hypothetical protein L1077_00295 [Pseudoalteromonas luteoviolacea]|uniref:Phage shock protein B n=1 Tax=Pseudoalteromonas luteoviolacea H33 TaxID=1365251 RepID=A0A167FKQ8_9GAMM|nr:MULTISPECIES: hypothetical protein [Pseudoalteromonas]KZN52452.1 hypothetical protein N476_10335 [Pseudoalteromonas luteoviolacea H33]KZN76616.1 hypothetical protein N477_16020 [Pseudoalteromonas luteoviolacea H33-S]MBQ4877111.1 hypothetical protein [Pseudoalteromonas luteoviolacea]MBQ4905972.1 hypothetical protein [Pseudoalteromonas luteoviolacea]MCF6437872.1 hypothetical protein [Pseudoalteromonas luteoviolacea]